MVCHIPIKSGAAVDPQSQAPLGFITLSESTRNHDDPSLTRQKAEWRSINTLR